MSNIVTNDDYERAYNDLDNQRIMLAASSSFVNKLTPEARAEQMRIALFRCLLKFDPSRGKKFTTSLFEYTKWACLNAVRDRKRIKHRSMISIEDQPEPTSPINPNQEDIDHIRECMGFLNPRDRSIIDQYYIQNMTLDEIGKSNAYTRQAASQNLTRATQRLRRICCRE